ncbi:MAG: WG repeat-containing protein [Pedobacter sp.]|uniref:WG repeat-containing protein n=1 Tax=Pedobacter sp. TaxID=1411316 RepID=UPI002808CDBB|nr:WG repeat-containing protein [Pedobacter sp.]MDQ8005706.1 WG repeat-containing protein [Pedobacter sp.]
MTKSISLITLVFCIFLSYGCSKNRSELEQAKDDLEDFVAKSENMIELADLEFNVKPVQINSNKAFDEKDWNNFTDQQRKYLSIDGFLAKVNEDFFLATEFGKPKSSVSISLNILDANELLGLGDDAEEASVVMPQFKPSLLHFWDGTSAEANYKVAKNTEELEYNHFLIAASKPIRSIDFDVQFKHYISTAYRLDDANPKIKVGDGYIEMKSNADGEVKLNYPKSLSEKLSEVQGFYKDGRALRKLGSSSYSISSAATIAWLKKALPIYEEAISLIDEQKLKTAQEVEAHLKSKLPLKPTQDAQMEFAKYYFSGPVNHLMVYVKNDKPQNVTKKVNVKLLKEMDAIGKEGYFVAVDSKKGLKGVVDVKGNWVINPIYDEIRAMGDEKFDVREGRIGTPRKLDVKNKKFINLLP